MLAWLKRNATPVSREQLVENESQTQSTEEKVQRLVGRHGTPNRTANERAGGFSQTYVIVVACQKGGSGKTTIAAHLAVQAANPAELWSGKAAFAIIDTPPALTTSIEQVIALADLVVIPARPSPHDLRAIGATVEIARRAGKPFLFVLNGAAPRANITAEAVAALSEHGPVAPVILHQRTDYAVSMIDGRTVMETVPTGRSAQEIAELWKYLYPRISLRVGA